MAIITICEHCGEKTLGKYCRYCNTKEKREAADRENEKIGADLHAKFGDKKK
jgi:hypothetical protein